MKKTQRFGNTILGQLKDRRRCTLKVPYVGDISFNWTGKELEAGKKVRYLNVIKRTLMIRIFVMARRLTIIPRRIVDIAPPMKPSQVFFGESLINGVLPQKNPNT